MTLAEREKHPMFPEKSSSSNKRKWDKDNNWSNWSDDRSWDDNWKDQDKDKDGTWKKW